MDSEGNYTDRRGRKLAVNDIVEVTTTKYPQGMGPIIKLPKEGNDWHGYPLVRFQDTGQAHHIPDSALERVGGDPGSLQAHLETLIKTTKDRNAAMRDYLNDTTTQPE